MKRTTAMLAGAATAALAVGVAVSPAIAEPIPAATSYADLLQPVPNAMERLAASDASQATGRVELAQYYRNDDRGYYHHHHHHHWRRDRAWYLNNGYYWSDGRWILRPVYHHHHHDWRRDRAWYLSNGYIWYGNQWVRRPMHHHHHHHHHDGY